MGHACHVDGCDDPVALQFAQLCNDCGEVVALARGEERDAKAHAATALDRVAHHEAAAPADDATASEVFDFHVARLHAIGEARRDHARHLDVANRAAVKARDHEAPHTHPVFVCERHVKGAK